MKIKLNKSTKIYIVATANSATGGPELLHQLAHILNNAGYKAFMYYIPNDTFNPVHKEYLSYNNPYVKSIDDCPDNIIIFPEMYWFFKIFDNLKNIQIIIWWLSVDNFIVSRSLTKYPYKTVISIFKTVNKIIKFPLFDIPKIAFTVQRNYKLNSDRYIKRTHLHLVQSIYARNFLINHNIDANSISYLSDYLNDDFLKICDATFNKENIVIYNPSKGFRFTKKIINLMSGVQFIPIRNMTRAEVKGILKRAKLYIDFGNHPGKDRLPREAAMLGCCVIVGKRGSAINTIDIPIKDSYKYNINNKELNKIIIAIEDCLNKYEEKIVDFQEYRTKILSEKTQFVDNVKEIFGK